MHPRRIAFRFLYPLLGSIVAICLSANVLSAQVKKDTLFFYNGSMISGELLSMRLGRIEFDADDIGVIKVKHGTAFFITHAHQVWQPLMGHHAGPGNARHPFGTVIPECDLQRGVDKEHRVAHVVEQLVLKQILVG